MIKSRLRLSAVSALALGAGSLLIAPELLAQDIESAASEAPADEVRLIDQIIDGGWFMLALALMSVAVVTLAVFNILQLSKKKFCPPTLRDELHAHMADVRVRTAIDVSAQDSSFLGRMCAVAYPEVDATDPESLGREEVENQIADFMMKEKPRYLSWIGYFSVIGQAAPMVGLMGTIAGMIAAFKTMGNDGGANPSELAGNISLALFTTFGGLVVAIPSIFCFFVFKNMLQKQTSDAQEAALEGLDLAIATVNADQQLAKVPEGISEEA